MTKRYPIKCYVLKAVQEISSVFMDCGRETFTNADIFEELRKGAQLNIKQRDVATIMARFFINGGFVEECGTEIISGKRVKCRKLTQKGINTNWKRVPSEKQISRENSSTFADNETEKGPVQPVDPVQAIDKEYGAAKRDLDESEDEKPEQIDLAEALINYVDDLKKRISLWEMKCRDLQYKLESTENEWRSTVRSKNKTIENLNQKIIALRNRINKGYNLKETRLLKDVAKFRGK